MENWDISGSARSNGINGKCCHVNVVVGDRPYYSRGPGYYVGHVYWVWMPGHWGWHHHHKVWIHGHYAPR